MKYMYYLMFLKTEHEFKKGQRIMYFEKEKGNSEPGIGKCFFKL